jgi:serine/threonine protein kinase
MICCLNPDCDGNTDPMDPNAIANPVNPDGATHCQYCRQPIVSLLKNRFKPLKVIGQGSFGRTYLAEDLDNRNASCVLKQLLAKPGSKAAELFDREAQQLQNLGEDNPQIPSLISYFEENKSLFLVQQFIQGQSLSKEFSQRSKLWTESI